MSSVTSLVRGSAVLLSLILWSASMASAADEAADYAPGTLVEIDFGNKSVGEVIEKTPTGWFKVRSLSRLGSERTKTLPRKYLSPAKPGAKFGDRLDDNEVIPKRVDRKPTDKAPSDRETAAAPSPSIASKPAKPASEKPAGSEHVAIVGALLVLPIDGERVGIVVELVGKSSYRIKFVGHDGVEQTQVFPPEGLRFAPGGLEYGFEFGSGEVLAPGKKSSRTDEQRQADREGVAEERRRKKELEEKRDLAVARAIYDPASRKHVATDFELPAETPEGKEEVKKMVGSWRVVEDIDKGVKNTRKQKVVITPTHIYFAAKSDSAGPFVKFRLDPTKSPKHLDHQWQQYGSTSEKEEVWKSIYELDGDRLKLCLGFVTVMYQKQERPTKFASESGMPTNLLVLTRLPEIATSPLKTSAEVDGELLKALDEWIALLEAKENRKFLDAAFSGPAGSVPKVEEVPPEHFVTILATLRGARRLIPAMSEGGGRADYDLTDWHIEAAQNMSTLKLAKKDGRWTIDMR